MDNWYNSGVEIARQREINESLRSENHLLSLKLAKVEAQLADARSALMLKKVLYESDIETNEAGKITGVTLR